MEMRWVAGKLGITDSRAVSKADEFIRLLKVKGWTLGEEAKRICSMELACQKFGITIDRASAVKLSCCGDQKTYQSTLAAAKSLLGIGQSMSIKDICLQSGAADCIDKANGIFSSVQSKMLSSMPEQRRRAADFGRPAYFAAAISIASRKKGVPKVDKKLLLGIADISELELMRTISLFESHLPELMSDKKKEVKKEVAIADGDDEDVDDDVIDQNDLDLDSAVDNPRLAGTKTVKKQLWKKDVIQSEAKQLASSSSSKKTSEKKTKAATIASDDSDEGAANLLKKSGTVSKKSAAAAAAAAIVAPSVQQQKIKQTTERAITTSLAKAAVQRTLSSSSLPSSSSSSSSSAAAAKADDASDDDTEPAAVTTATITSVSAPIISTPAIATVAVAAAAPIVASSSTPFGTVPLSAPVIPGRAPITSKLASMSPLKNKYTSLSSSSSNGTSPARTSKVSTLAMGSPSRSSSNDIKATKSTVAPQLISVIEVNDDDDDDTKTNDNDTKKAPTSTSSNSSSSSSSGMQSVFARLMAAGRTAPSTPVTTKGKKRKDPSSSSSSNKKAPQPARKRSSAAVAAVAATKSSSSTKRARTVSSDDEQTDDE